MIDASALQMLLMVLTGWLERREREALAYLIEENRLLRRQLGGRPKCPTSRPMNREPPNIRTVI